MAPERARRIYRSTDQATIVWIAVVLFALYYAGLVIQAMGDVHALVIAPVTALFGAAIFYLVRLARAGVRIGSDGAHVMNIRRTIQVPWDEIERFSVGPHGLSPKSAFVELRGGERIAIWGIQAPNVVTRPKSRSAERLVEALNEELAQHRSVPGAERTSDSTTLATPRWTAAGPERLGGGPRG
jgi:hypothetical protein